MLQVLHCITGQHDIRLVVLAAMVGFIACFTTVTLLSRAALDPGKRRLQWLIAASVAFGSGTWAAHFIGMLAYSAGLPMSYNPFDTFVSVLVAILGSGLGLYLFIEPSRRWMDVPLAGLILGGSIAAMHFIGMYAVHVPGHLEFNGSFVAGALFGGVVPAAMAFLWGTPLDTIGRRLLAASLLAFSILALHFTAMTALTIRPDAAIPVPAATIDPDLLACVVAGVVVLILLGGLAVSRFDQHLASRAADEATRFRQLTEATFEGIFIHRAGTFLEVNAAFCRFFGRDARSLVGSSIFHLLAPQSVQQLDSRLAEARQDIDEFVVIAAGGVPRTIEVVTRDIDYYGRPARVVAIRDITERKSSAALLTAERGILEAIAEDRPLADTLDLLCRAADAAMPGATCSVLIMAGDGETMLHGAGPGLPAVYSAAIDGQKIGPCAGSCGTAAFRRVPVIVEDIETDPLWADYRQLARDNGLRACWSTPLIGTDDKVLGTFAIYRPETHRPSEAELAVVSRMASVAAIAIQRKNLHEALVEEKDRANAANLAKSEFLANMSHELRTPLNAILGFSEMIKTQALGTKAMDRYIDYAGDINRSGRLLLDLINDVLDVARVEAGKLQINREPCHLPNGLGEQRSLVMHAYPDAARIDIACGADCPGLFADARALGQVLRNIVGNAAKFTPPDGHISVSVDWNAPGLRIRIEDTGPGIPAHMLAELGQPFRQVQAAYSRSHKGSGLGLYISRALMEAHQGRLEMFSAPARGTTVQLSFPETAVMRDIQPGIQPIKLIDSHRPEFGARTKVG